MKEVALDLFKDASLVGIQHVNPLLQSDCVSSIVVHVNNILHCCFGFTFNLRVIVFLVFRLFVFNVSLPGFVDFLKGARTSSGAWAGSVAKGFISETKAATGLQQRPTERPMPLQHAAANSRLQQ